MVPLEVIAKEKKYIEKIYFWSSSAKNRKSIITISYFGIQWNFTTTNICGTNVIVHCGWGTLHCLEVSASFILCFGMKITFSGFEVSVNKRRVNCKANL